MKNYLFAALLGCFVVSGLAQTRDFTFTDTQGRCWQCPVGVMCFPCPGVSPVVIPPEQTDPTCAAPTCQDPGTRHILFSHNIAHKFYQCVAQGTVWGAVEMNCPCELMFNYRTQACDWTWQWEPFCAAPIVQVLPCEITTTTLEPPTTKLEETVTTTVATTTPNPCQCIPWIPCWCNPCMGGMGGMMGGMGCMG